MNADFLQARLRDAQGEAAKREILQRIREEKLRERIQDCDRCPLHASRKQAVPFSGPSNFRAHLIVVGEAPGRMEDEKGVPFVGRSGKLLDEVFESLGTARRHMFVCNTLCCRPPNNRDPEQGELEACRVNFDAQLEMAGTHVGMALGGFAIANVLGETRGSIKVADYLEKPVWKNGRIWFGTYHPAYALRNPSAKQTIQETFQMALAVRFGEVTTPYPVWEEVTISGHQGTSLGEAIDKRGWAFLHSEVLDSQIVVTAESYGKVERIPASLAHLPRYDIDELIAIGEIGGRKGWTRQDLRRMHMVKHEFGGTILLDDRKVSA